MCVFLVDLHGSRRRMLLWVRSVVKARSRIRISRKVLLIWNKAGGAALHACSSFQFLLSSLSAVSTEKLSV